MAIRIRTFFFIGLGLLTIWFLYLERAILTPFILAAIFAYIFNPVVNFFYHKIRLPRTISIIIIYLIIISAIIIFGMFLTKRVGSESLEFRVYLVNLIQTTKSQVSSLPDWLKPVVIENLISLEKSNLFSPAALFATFPAAISRIISLFIFLFSAFYFLKEGRNFVDKFLFVIPSGYRVETEIVLRKINTVFGAYLRGQLFLVFIVSLMLFISLSILGIRFALILAIFSGFAEIIPIIGPILAGTIAALVALITGNNNFGLTPLNTAIIVGIIYFVIRQFQDYFINPFVLGKITNLHPLVVLFVVLAGGHLWGWLGLILAVPIAAALRIFLEFLFDTLNEKSQKNEDEQKNTR